MVRAQEIVVALRRGATAAAAEPMFERWMRTRHICDAHRGARDAVRVCVRVDAACGGDG